MLSIKTNIIGEFQEKDHGNFFSYRETVDDWAISRGMTHEIDVLDGFRFGIVKKTVAYISVDEDEYGNPVIEKWNIKNHKTFA